MSVDKVLDPEIGDALYTVLGHGRANRDFKISKYIQPTAAVLLGKKSDGSFAPVNIDDDGKVKSI